jgi:membrane-associated phospholipid phosphatase
MDRPLPLPSLRPSTAIAGAAIAALLFALLAADLLLHGPVTRADTPISHWFSLHAQPWTTQLMLAMSALHSTVALGVFTAGLAAVLVLLGQKHWLPLLIAVVPGGQILNALVKLAFHRARPVFDHPLVSLPTFSFPSGHASGATVWWGFVLVLWFAIEPRFTQRAIACALGIAMVLATVLSRVYLGAHYPSDVLAGIAEGTFWLVLCCCAAGAWARRRTVPEGRA